MFSLRIFIFISLISLTTNAFAVPEVLRGKDKVRYHLLLLDALYNFGLTCKHEVGGGKPGENNGHLYYGFLSMTDPVEVTREVVGNDVRVSMKLRTNKSRMRKMKTTDIYPYNAASVLIVGPRNSLTPNQVFLKIGWDREVPANRIPYSIYSDDMVVQLVVLCQ